MYFTFKTQLGQPNNWSQMILKLEGSLDRLKITYLGGVPILANKTISGIFKANRFMLIQRKTFFSVGHKTESKMFTKMTNNTKHCNSN